MDNNESKLLDTVEALLLKKPKSPGVKINNIFPDSPASRAGIKPGDVIIAIDDCPILTMQDYIDSCNSRTTSQVFDILRNNNLIRIKMEF
jgi:S1-C subfamily serine protease